ncbi:PREDICTED: receptor-like protein 12 [Ipomoea nil]|uniref:receptor-like protein 12 n=1 Tax=Ipomoea nil TaxID=35883 RepID=UPI000901A0C9|nr:PREDICTED: receptor-like protein 12 [Ipomoea nil]
MERLILLFFCLLVQAIVSSSENQLCHNDQTSALLQIKNALTIDESVSLECDLSGEHPYPKTISWNSSTDCCKWDGVTCDELTGEVIGLDLSCSHLTGTIDSNSTLFQLSHLQSLNLAHNDFSLSQIPYKFGLFPSLRHLNLSNTGFSGGIPSEISRLSKLISLDLSGNFEGLKLEPHSFKHLLQNLTQLRELDLSGIEISSVLPRNLSSSLRILSLVSTGLYGKFPDSVFDLPNLERLILNSNFDLQGHLPKTVWKSSISLKELDLSSTSFSGELQGSVGYIKSLTYLDLSSCKFSGAIPESLGNLTRIENLILFSNNFTGRVPLSLVSLEQLIRFDLSANNLTGEIPDFFGKFRKLKDLSLADNSFTGRFPVSVTNLTQLESLDLSNTSISGPIPPIVSGFPALVLLFLGENLLTGEIPSWVFRLPSLKYLDMKSNNLSGRIERFSSEEMVHIDLSDNKLRGSIPSSLSKLVNLTALYLSSNNFSGTLDVGTFSNLRQLRHLGLSYNSISLSAAHKEIALPDSIGNLWLSSCDIRELDFLREAKHLGQLDLSGNKIRGQIPDWALSNWGSSVYYLNLSFNSLTGINNLNRFENLVYVDLRFNLLRGSLPVPSSTTQIFFASNNNLTGEIPVLVCNLSSLVVLDLSNNSLTGMIPKCLSSVSRSLSVLDLHGNRFHGTIPGNFGTGNRLRTLNLYGNQLEGTVPRSLAKCRLLEVLDLGNNNLNGTFPNWLGSLPGLKVLSLRSNRLNGPININTSQTKPAFPELRIFDLSHNGFTGTLPLELFRNFKAMMETYNTDPSLKYIGETFYKDSVTVMIKGQDVKLLKVLSIFTAIDLSSNEFEAIIPVSIGSLTSLRGLNLSHNNLAGHIPGSLGTILDLESLDLSSNHLDGEIPGELVGLTFLSVLNLSQNHLEGRIPQGNQFNTFQNDSYFGNDGLCGVPLLRRCKDDAEKPPPGEDEDGEDDDDDSDFMHGFGWRSVMIGYGVGIVPGLVMGPLIFFPTGIPKWLQQKLLFRKH